MPRLNTLPLPLFLAGVLSPAVFAQTTCAFHEERKLQTVAGVFAVGLTTIRVTLPLDFDIEITAFLEVSNGGSNEPPQEMFMEAGGSRIPIRNGAPLHVIPPPNRFAPGKKDRVVISLLGAGGELCSWHPKVSVSPRDRSSAFTVLNSKLRYRNGPGTVFLNLGDPIFLEVSAIQGRAAADIFIGGLPAVILARSPSCAVVRDPQPEVGLRTVRSQGESLLLAFVDTQLQMPTVRGHGSGTVRIKVVASDMLQPPAYVTLYNFSDEIVRLSSGTASRNSWDDATVLRLNREKAGTFTAACDVKFRREGRIQLDTLVTKGPEQIHSWLPQWPIHPWSFPRTLPNSRAASLLF
jgi:hypothetical protein